MALSKHKSVRALTHRELHNECVMGLVSVSSINVQQVCFVIVRRSVIEIEYIIIHKNNMRVLYNNMKLQKLSKDTKKHA